MSNNVWDKPGPLNVVEAERVRLHPYLTERTLAGTPALASLGAVAVQHHERLDGSGYPSGLSGEAITPAGRLLGAADTYRAKTEHRPRRPAETPSEAARLLRDEVRAGRLDGDAVEAVLRAAGHRPRRRREAVAGLTAREIEVLRLVARGLSTKQVAQALGISRKTAANHTERVYAKIGVTNRRWRACSPCGTGSSTPARRFERPTRITGFGTALEPPDFGTSLVPAMSRRPWTGIGQPRVAATSSATSASRPIASP